MRHATRPERVKSVGPLQTPLCYMGGKQRLSLELAHALPEHGVYVEPFAGGLALLFAKRPAPLEVVNDLDSCIATFWRVLRDDPENLARVCEQTPCSREEFELAKREPVCPPRPWLSQEARDLETARRLFVRYDQSFSSGGRGFSWRNKIQADRPPRLMQCAGRLKGLIVENKDALELIPEWDVDGGLIYCDPPYHPDTRDPNLYEEDVDTLFHERLVGVLNGLRNATYVLSGYAHPVYERLEGAECFIRTQHRDAGAKKGDPGRHGVECIWAPRGVLAWQQSMF